MAGNGDSGVSRTEVLGAFFLLAALFLVLMLAINPADITGGGSVSVYRSTNAIYAHGLLVKAQSAVRTYYDAYGQLPGDCPDLTVNSKGERIGNGNGRIERENEEDLKAISDLLEAGNLKEDMLRVRGRELRVYWTILEADGHVVAKDNFLMLEKFNKAEALAMDRKYDDGRRDSGQILYILNDDDETASLYMALNLYN